MQHPAPNLSLQHSGRSSNDLMLLVIIAAVPGLVCATWLFGVGVPGKLLLAMVTALLLEIGMTRLRGNGLTTAVSDRSGIVAALLFALAIPPGLAWWLVPVGMGFAILIGKHAFGGLGQNPFNPAMCGYLFLVLAFPEQMANRLEPAPGQNVAFPYPERMAPLNMAYLAGGMLLLGAGVIRWHIPLAIIISVALLAVLFQQRDPGSGFTEVWLHLFGGATMLAAFFIATDPVSAATSNGGRLAYGIVIGASLYGISAWSKRPDGIAAAVVFGNFCAPLLDHWFRPRIHGQPRAWSGRSGP